ncbi:hypothetical protein BLNAU_14836 [Blattamonas nauphoetae]|uniref:Uncharacterized protein n=1 Tax=Blattamonas nauphoetae TaxID=2049346 RepID=A0ABQ9XFY7_9EUKA|nr:hypothetical protein BLNAU_14836 [Blattamonas nauphoetae]
MIRQPLVRIEHDDEDLRELDEQMAIRGVDEKVRQIVSNSIEQLIGAKEKEKRIGVSQNIDENMDGT